MATKMVTAIEKGGETGATVQKLVETALSKLGDLPVSLSLIYCSSEYDYQVVVDTIRERTGKAPLLGCSSAGEFNEDSGVSQGMTLALISSDTHRFYTSLGRELQKDPMACVMEAKAKLPEKVEGFPHHSALLVHDGLVGRGEEAVLSATLSLGPAFRFAGGSAADDLKFEETHIFVDDMVRGDAFGLCMIASQQPPAIGFKHGHRPYSDTLVSTKAEESVLYEVNGLPAWEVWKDVLREKAMELSIDVDAITDPSDVGQFLIRYELGLSTGKDYKVRVPLSKNDDGSLNFACTIPSGASFKIMESKIDDQIESARVAATNAMANMEGRKIAGALIFDCVCRGIILGDRFYEGVEQIKNVVGHVPLIGFETYGEICMEMGQLSGYHNTSTVVYLLAD